MQFYISDYAMEKLLELRKKNYRIKAKSKTWCYINYNLVQDEQKNDDIVYKVGNINILIDKDLEREVPFISIDFCKDWWGEDFEITTKF